MGNAFLVLAAAGALFSAGAFLVGVRRHNDRLIAWGRTAAYIAAGSMTLAVATLLLAILSHDYSLRYVYNQSSNDTPFLYLVSALWAGNPGSLLFWGWLVAAVGALLLWRNRVNKAIVPYAMLAILATEILFLILILLPAQNPFIRLSPYPSDGLGMNPLLQNIGMVVHPPMLLIGWALTLVPFAIAIGALVTRRLDSDWLVSARRWAVAAWLFLGIGNLLGAWWAYYELGWGGYWAWDPVENAGLMPWLLLTAFLHSTMMQRRRGFNKHWNVLLVIFIFLLTIFGAYLTRSDVLNSVHTFGQTPAEPIFLIFMVLMLVGSLWLVISRWRDLKGEEGDDAFVSGETTFFINNMLFTLAALVIFGGTMYPWFSRVFLGDQIEFEPRVFNGMVIPVFLLIIMLAGLCVLIGFKKPDMSKLGRSLIVPAAGSLLIIIVMFILGRHEWYVLVASFAMSFALIATLYKWWRDVAQHHQGKRESLYRSFRRLFSGGRARYGGYIIHIAIVLIALGITGSSAYDVRRDQVVLAQDESVTVQAYTFTYLGYTPSSTENTMTLAATVQVSRGGNVIGNLYPELRYDGRRETTTAEAAVRSTLLDDVYISIYQYDTESSAAAFTILVNPMVSWIWIGSIVMLLGGLWAFSAAPKKPSPDD
jgi:cytochrome c-type biogenesis protein CcmF